MFEYCIKILYSTIEKMGFKSILLETSREGSEYVWDRERKREREERERETERERENIILKKSFRDHFHKASLSFSLPYLAP